MNAFDRVKPLWLKQGLIINGYVKASNAIGSRQVLFSNSSAIVRGPPNQKPPEPRYGPRTDATSIEILWFESRYPYATGFENITSYQLYSVAQENGEYLGTRQLLVQALDSESFQNFSYYMPNVLEGSTFKISVEATNQYGSSPLSSKLMTTVSPPEIYWDALPSTFEYSDQLVASWEGAFDSAIPILEYKIFFNITKY